MPARKIEFLQPDGGHIDQKLVMMTHYYHYLFQICLFFKLHYLTFPWCESIEKNKVDLEVTVEKWL